LLHECNHASKEPVYGLFRPSHDEAVMKLDYHKTDPPQLLNHSLQYGD
jgi:hypothetical protein